MEHKKEHESHENEGMAPGKDEAPADHADQAQDIELIKKILGEYLGHDDADNKEAMKACHEAVEAYKEMGYKEEEAHKLAGEAMKLAKHMASKKEAHKEDEAKEGEEKPMPKKDKDHDADDKKEEKHEAKKESASAEIARLRGELARFKEAEKKALIEKKLDSKLAALKESRQVTDEIRKLIGTPKSEAHIDSVISAFMAGFKESSKKKEDVSVMDFACFTEKTVRTTESAKATNFADCLK